MNNAHVQSPIRIQEVTMSLLQRTGVYQKTDHWHPAFTPSGGMTSDVSERSRRRARTRCGHAVAGGRCCGRAGHHEICALRKMVWRPAHKVRGAEGRSYIVCSCCYLRGACPRACERNVPERIFTHRSLTNDSEVVRSIIATWASSCSDTEDDRDRCCCSFGRE